MAGIRTQFENGLREKLSQKSTAHVSDETILIRAFKYFDLDNTETVDIDEWKKAIEKIGVVLPNPQVVEELFRYYDTDKSGALDYKEFSAIITGDSAVSKSPQKSISLSTKQEGEASIQKLRDRLAARGGSGIIGLARQFKIMDDDNSKELDLSEFTKALRDYRVEITGNDIQNIFKYIDRNRSGAIDYDEFLRAVRGPMNGFRKALVARAFDKLDSDGSGILDINDVKKFYNARGHPDVRSGKKTEDDVLGEFLETFEMHHNLDGGTNDRRVTREEFDEYYNNISSSIDNDQYFELMMNNAWKLTEAPAYTKNKAWRNEEDTKKAPPSRGGRPQPAPAERPSSSVPRGFEDLFERFRGKLAARGARGIIGIQRQFKIMDDDNSHTLSLSEFKKGCSDFRVDLPDSDIVKLFNAIDRDRSGLVDYDELIRAVRGPMNQARKNIVKQAWNKLDRDGSGIIDINDLRGVYDARGHPDVKSGKKTEDEILGEFLETFETHHNISDLSKRDRRVTSEEFEEYYNNVSASIDNDQYFEVMMTNAWKLGQQAPKQDAWRGDIGFAGQRRTEQRKGPPYGVTEAPTDYTTTSKAKPVSPGGPVDALLALLREKLASRGARGFIGLSRQFKIMDDDNSKCLNVSEFVKAMRDFRLNLNDEDSRRLFAYVDADHSGEIDYEEFVHRVRGVMNNARKQLVTQAFNKLDKNGNGIVELDDIKGVYNASLHPDVRSGKKTEDDILCEFLDTFETHHALYKENTRDFRVTLDEFMEYYAHVSASIDDDRYFELMMKNSWNFEGKTYQKGWSADATSPAKRRK
jgi:Ca2+-binding EF-hand superfamily protein